MTIAALIVAAGRGSRAGTGLPKQYRRLDEKPVLAHTLSAFCAHATISRILVVIHPDDAQLYADCLDSLAEDARTKLLAPVSGGETRQASVHSGLAALDDRGFSHLLVHDAARPFVSPALIDRACAALDIHDAALPGIAVIDTIKRIDVSGRVTETPPRSALRAVQTPQAFRLSPLRAAHARAAAAGREDFTDDGALMEWAGVPVTVFEGDPLNVKLTHEADFMRHARAETAGSSVSGKGAMITRMATGFDVHVFGPGDHVMLGGVAVPHDRGVVAHSDGDVVLHALTDALLGCLAEGDIGTHFPPSDPQWRDASSDRFLAYAVQRLRERGGRIVLLDATILCERPKIGPQRDAMRARIAGIAGIGPERVSIKATTTEKLGFTGRGEGIAAQAAATIALPADQEEAP